MIASPIPRETLLAYAQKLPAAPQIMARLHRLLLDFNSGLDAVTALLKRDAALTSRIIRIANSSAYGQAGVGTIEQALQRVGFGEVYRLVGFAASASLNEKSLGCYGYDREALRSHDLLCALVAEGVARRLGADARACYSAGLLRSIGKILLDRAGHATLSTEACFHHSRYTAVIAWEQDNFGVSHLDVNRLLLSEWGFPAEIAEACAQPMATPATTELGLVIQLSEHIVASLGAAMDGDGLSTDVPENLLAEAKLTGHDVSVIGSSCNAALQAMQGAL